MVQTMVTNPGRTPDDNVWNISIPHNVPEDMKLDFLALLIERREELLVINRNVLTDENVNLLNETRASASKNSFFII